MSAQSQVRGKSNASKTTAALRSPPAKQMECPLGEWVAAHAVEVTDPESADLVRRLLEKKYGAVQVKAFAAMTALRKEKYTVLKIQLQ